MCAAIDSANSHKNLEAVLGKEGKQMRDVDRTDRHFFGALNRFLWHYDIKLEDPAK